MKNALIILVFLAVLGGAAYGGWTWWKNAKMKELAAMTPELTAQVERKDIALTVELAGDIQPEVQVEVKSEVSAKIKKLHIELGDEVKKGALLVELDDQDLLTEKESAEIEIEGFKLSMEKAVADFKRDGQLFEKQLITESAYLDSKNTKDLAENNFNKSQKRLQNVQDRLSKTKVMAPMDGKVLELPVVEGQVVVAAASVNSGTMLMKLADLSKLLISTHVNQVDVAKLNVGMRIGFTVDSIPGVKMEGIIKEMAPTATVKNNVKGFTVDLSIENPDKRVRPGMTADVVIPIEEVKDVLAVPISAVFSEKGAKVVFVKSGAPGVAPEVREVQIGIANIDFVEIKSGLNGEETVLLTRPLSQKPDRS